MQAGKMDRWATLLDRSGAAAGDFNEPADGNTARAGFWVEYLPLKGEDYFEAGKSNARVVAKLRAHWRDDVFADARIGLEGRTFNVVAVLEIGLHDGIEIWVSEAKAQR